MLFKSSGKSESDTVNLTLLQRPLSLSVVFHLLGMLCIFLVTLRPELSFKKKTVDFEVISYPAPATALMQVNPPKEEIKPKPKIEPRAVFGVSRQAITAETVETDLAQVKQGNTVAKEQDDLQLNKDDVDQLPIPADDFLVSSMPRLKSEIRIPYPEEAKKAGVEGPVVMDLLIDAQGKVRKVELIKGPGFGLNEAAIAAAQRFEFVPGRVRENPVAVKIRYTYRFILEGR